MRTAVLFLLRALFSGGTAEACLLPNHVNNPCAVWHALQVLENPRAHTNKGYQTRGHK